ncbi:MAG TPA: Hsp70 family protein [Micromonosporaceae bacterium]|nr:Hsp70 family protein [Micromonosporaceae bacterium]
MPADGLPGRTHQLGIDFGSSNTVAVVRWPDGRARPLLFDGSPLLPSAAYAEPSGALVVGRDAVHSSRLDPARFEPNPKRRIDEGVLLLGDREVPVVDVVAAVLARVVDEWRRTVGGAAQPGVTLTCPAVWGAPRRRVLIEAAARVGLPPVRLVAEPVAAAAYFAQCLGRDVPIGSVVVVHDVGAGTFDASVVARTSSGFDVLAVDGRDDIGGLDIDAAVIDHLEKLYAPRAPQAWARLASPSTVEERRAKRLLWDDVKTAKERLSRSPAADLVVPLADIEVHLTREELEVLARPLLEQTVRVTQGVIRWSNLAPGRLAGVFLVGGSSRIPLLATLLHRELGEPPVVLEQPELVVAEGSVLAGALALGEIEQPAPGPATGMLPRLTPEMFGAAGMPAAPGQQVAAAAGGPAGLAPVSPAAASPAPASRASAAPTSPAPAVPISGPPAVPGAAAAPAGSPAPAGSSAPERSVGRVIVPGAQPPSRPRSPAAPVAPTVPMPRFDQPAYLQGHPALRPPGQPAPQQPAPHRPVQPAPRQAAAPRQPPRYPPGPPAPPPYPRPAGPGAGRRLLARLLIALLLVAVPLVAAVLAYYITADQLPDLDTILRR